MPEIIANMDVLVKNISHRAYLVEKSREGSWSTDNNDTYGKICAPGEREGTIASPSNA